MRLFGLIGYPLEHSFSPQYFTDKFEKEGIVDCRYDRYAIKSLQEIQQVLAQNTDLVGLNITIPYKLEIMNMLASRENIPTGLNACNCVKIVEGKLLGYNTDIIGFEKSLTPLLRPRHQKALVLGNGGVTAAVVYVLKKLGIEAQIVSRTMHEDSSFTYDDLNESIVNENLLIINTTPLGMFPHLEEAPSIPYQFLSGSHLCYDLIYNPEKTLFLQTAEARGALIKNGMEMLIIQAEESWRIWNED